MTTDDATTPPAAPPTLLRRAITGPLLFLFIHFVPKVCVVVPRFENVQHLRRSLDVTKYQDPAARIKKIATEYGVKNRWTVKRGA